MATKVRFLIKIWKPNALRLFNFELNATHIFDFVTTSKF